MLRVSAGVQFRGLLHKDEPGLRVCVKRWMKNARKNYHKLQRESSF